MSEIFHFLMGFFRLRICGAAPEMALNRLARAHILFWDIEKPDEFTCEISVRRRDRKKAAELLQKAQADVKILGEYGMPARTRFLRKRKLLLVLLAAALALAYALTQFVWFIRVEGNEQVPTERILRELEDLGIGFGTPCSAIVPQDLKNKMLVRVPELGWLTVNHFGGLATVVVREREPDPKVIDLRLPTNLIASRDGLITDISVLSGYPVCTAGQTVQKGQLLVSGYADYGYCTHACRSLAEIYARTWREQNAITPQEVLKKTYTGRVVTQRWLVLGRKRIKISANSGIPLGRCDKMTEYRTLTLPGGYAFPVRLEVQTMAEYALAPAVLESEQADAILRSGTAKTVRTDMIAGEILRENLKTSLAGGRYVLSGNYECREMIAQTVKAEIFEGD